MAKRDQKLDGHLLQQRVEDAQFLLGTGLHITLVARRLGISRDLLEKNLDREVRSGWRERYPGTLTTFGDGA